MTPPRELLEWTWVSYDEVLWPIDIMLTVAIIGIAAATALGAYRDYPFRAKLVEAYLAASAQRGDLVERLALSGDPVEMPLVAAGTAAGSVTLDDHLSGRRAARTRAVEAKSGPTAAADATAGIRALRTGGAEVVRSSSKYVSSAGIVGSAILVTGTIDGRAYEFGMFPAALEDETPSVYSWYCGRRRVPDGMLAQPPAIQNALPDELLAAPCRRGRAR